MPQTRTVYFGGFTIGTASSSSVSSSSARSSSVSSSFTSLDPRFSSSSDSSISSGKGPDSPSSSYSGTVRAPCGTGHVCNRATFNIMIADKDGSSTSLNPEPQPGEILPGEVQILQAQLNNAGGGLGGPDNGPGLPSDLGTPTTFDRFSVATITAEQSQQIFGAKDKDGQVKSFRLRIVPIPENNNPHRGVTWVRIKNTCDQVVYSCCLEISDGDTRPPGGGGGSYGHGIGSAIFSSSDHYVLKQKYNFTNNDLSTFKQLSHQNTKKFKYKNIFYDVTDGIGRMKSNFFHQGFVTLMKKNDFEALSLFKDIDIAHRMTVINKIKSDIDNNVPISPATLTIMTFNNQKNYVIDYRGLERVIAVNSNDDYMPIFIAYPKWNILNINEKEEIIKNLNTGVTSADNTKVLIDLFQINFY